LPKEVTPRVPDQEVPVLARHGDVDDGVDARGQVDEDVAGQGEQVERRVVGYLYSLDMRT